MFTFLALIQACDGPAPTWNGDIQPIAQAHCVDCHSEGAIAPFTLETPDDWALLEAPIRSSVNERSMPPWGAEEGHQDYLYDVSLTDEQIAAIDDWYEAGMPDGEEGSGTPIELDLGGMERVDLELQMPAAYTPSPGATDDYRCFAMEWPYEDTRYVTGFNAVPGNLLSVHHAVAYWISPRNAETIRSFDGLDEAPGYPCYGGPTMTGWEPDGLEDSVLTSFLGQWAPGMQGVQFGDGLGIEAEPGGMVVLQMHYYLGSEGDLTDQSAVQFTVEEEVEQPGFYAPWFDLLWYAAPETMLIPAGSTSTSHSYTGVFEDNTYVSKIANADFSSGVQIHSIFPHMHTLGRELTLTLVRGDGSEETLLNVPDYDFNWQRDYFLAQPVTAEATDELRIECSWDNSEAWRAANGVEPAEPVDVGWGEDTTDEMCIAMVFLSANPE